MLIGSRIISIFTFILVFHFENIKAENAGILIEPITGPYFVSEGPHWDYKSNLLFFVSIYDQTIYCWNYSSHELTHAYIRTGPVSVIVPVANTENVFLVGSGRSLVQVFWDPSTNNTNPDIKVLQTIEPRRINNRFNDGKVDPEGRFWAGTTVDNGQDSPPNDASLYRFAADGTPTTIISSVSISNGLVWNHDNDTFYYIDSPQRKVFVYDYDVETADISNKRVLFDFDKYNLKGVPDGMTIDGEGNLWVADNGGGKVLEVDAKSGQLLRAIDMPVSRVSSVAFGGPKEDILYVTSAKEGLSDSELKAQPLAGSVFAIYGLGVFGSPMLACRMQN